MAEQLERVSEHLERVSEQLERVSEQLERVSAMFFAVEFYRGVGVGGFGFVFKEQMFVCFRGFLTFQ